MMVSPRSLSGRFVRGEPLERFVKFIEFEDGGCWSWLGVKSAGYGRFWASVETGLVLAHRWAYSFWSGPIPRGLQVDHLCGNRACVNPAHLEAVTSQVNLLRSPTVSTLNARKTECVRAHRFTEGNTYVYHGDRHCRSCRRDRERVRRERSRS